MPRTLPFGSLQGLEHTPGLRYKSIMNAPPAHLRKQLGAFYTPPELVDFMVRWASDEPVVSVLDPACGDGRFLLAAKALEPQRLVGCDVSENALEATRQNLAQQGVTAELVGSDFFAIVPSAIEPVDLAIGNPPFIRYQQFSRRSRSLALEAALRVGVRLSRLTSSWAPFLLHSMQFVRPGGRMAMVVPAEITQTQYGLRTLRAILGHFAKVQLVTLERNVFADAQVETGLLLASDRGGSCEHLELFPTSNLAELRLKKASTQPVEISASGLSRFAEAFLSRAEREAWERIRQHPHLRTVASLAEVNNGYVTGDNEFFHTTQQDALQDDLPSAWLRPVVRGGKSLMGLHWTKHDLTRLEEKGVPHHLVEPREDLFAASHRPSLERWLEKGEKRGTPGRFKCRTRDPWWRVPGAQTPHIFFTYMAGAHPRASINMAGASYPNTLHGLTLRRPEDAPLVAMGFYTSATLLSVEVEGRSYGGGVLKVEPRELDRVLVPASELPPARLDLLGQQMDQLLRQRDYDAASRLADETILVEGLGLSTEMVELLRSGRRRLLERRSKRNKRSPTP